MLSRKKEGAVKPASETTPCVEMLELLTRDVAGLHLLALLLTADEDKAESCFVRGLQEGIHSNSIFHDWACEWSKRAIVRNALYAVRPVLGEANAIETAIAGLGGPARGARQGLVAAVTSLSAFDRFVFVLAVLEGESVYECAALLGCREQDILDAKVRSMTRVASLNFMVSSAAIDHAPRAKEMTEGPHSPGWKSDLKRAEVA